MTTTTTMNLTDSKGFTLMEVIVVVLLTSVLGLMAISALTLMRKTKTVTQYSVDAEENARALSLALPAYLGQAVEVDWTNTVIGNIDAGRGRLRLFKSELAAADSKPVAVGVFLREVGRPSQQISTSDIRATAMYFRNPTPTEGGELIFSSSQRGTGNVMLSPDQAEQRFGSIVELEVSPGGYPVAIGSAVRTAKVRIVYRKFLGTDKRTWRWCPASQSTSVECETTNYRDIERIHSVLLPNNSITTNLSLEDGSPRKETVFGDLYFFRLAWASK